MSELTIPLWLGYVGPALFLTLIAVLLAVRARTTRPTIRHIESSPIDERLAASPQKFILVNESNDDQRFEVDSSPFRIGRSSKNNLRVSDLSVSRYHAELTFDPIQGAIVRRSKFVEWGLCKRRGYRRDCVKGRRSS